MKIRIAATLVLLSSPAFAKDPATGKTTFFTYEAFMSPTQQPGEDTDAPKALEKATGLQNTQPATPHEQRKSMGWGQLRFAQCDVELGHSALRPPRR